MQSMLVASQCKEWYMEDLNNEVIGEVSDNATQPAPPEGMEYTPFDGQPLDEQPVAGDEDAADDQDSVVN